MKLGMKPLLATMVLVAGCSTSSPTPQIVYVTPVPTTYPAQVGVPSSNPVPVVVVPTPTPDPAAEKAAAAKVYAAIASKYNKANNALNRGCGKHFVNLKSARACEAKYATANHTFYVAVAAMVVPPDVAADQKALVKASSAEWVDNKIAASARTISDWNAALTAIDKSSTTSSKAANIFRLDLGLPPVPIY